MTNSLLAMHPAVQHMVLHLMNINAVKYKWSSGTRADGWETPADGIIIQRGSNLTCFSSGLLHSYLGCCLWASKGTLIH